MRNKRIQILLCFTSLNSFALKYYFLNLCSLINSSKHSLQSLKPSLSKTISLSSLQELHLEYLFPAPNPLSLAILEASTLSRCFTVLLKRLFDIFFRGFIDESFLLCRKMTNRPARMRTFEVIIIVYRTTVSVKSYQFVVTK